LQIHFSPPFINLTKGFLDYRSTENDVEKNILVVEGSSYPDTKKGNLIIAGHSGTGWKAFFNDLYKLTQGDVAYITYKGKKYTYQIVNIYKQPRQIDCNYRPLRISCSKTKRPLTIHNGKECIRP